VAVFEGINRTMENFVTNAHKKRWCIALSIFLICLTLFLSIRASDKYRWSDWGFGDAQSMLSLKHWEEGGWIFNKFLFVPQGYATAVYLFDEPALRQHAHGINPGVSKTVGPTLRYTHYPSGYLVPYAILFRIGLDDMFHVRMLSILFSIVALILMYILFSRIASHGVAFIAVVFYGLSPSFLGYADTIANQPIDDLLRFAFMLTVVLSTRTESMRQRKKWMVSAWIFEFMLSLSSFDSVFFIYFWLIAWYAIDGKGFRWKTYLIYALAPISAHSLQFLQNVWYLGFTGAVVDIKDTFILKSGADSVYNILSSGMAGRGTTILDTVDILFQNLYSPNVLIIVMAVFYIIYSFLLKSREERSLPTLRLLIGLFLCGSIIIIILPHAARMSYEARQMMPFVSLLVGGVVWSFVKEFKYSIHGKSNALGEGESKLRRGVRLSYLLLSSVLILYFGYSFMLNNRQPVYLIPDEKTDMMFASEISSSQRLDLMRFRTLREEVLLAEALDKMPVYHEPVFFSVNGFSLFWQHDYVPGYPQIMPLLEYYVGSRPILCFDTYELLVNDLVYLIKRSPYRFSPVLVTSSLEQMDQILNLLMQVGMLRDVPMAINNVMGRSVLDITDYLRWQ
jgi:hypothetical protein